ncbi:helix-turn-helix transcriptional regulator [Streptomyces tubercidicus]|uniref:helix-turn-helix transcriptional regulator n=1 Tax=Streptomyces tubercidicus TaxID=47759 RepID=UPI0022B7736B|nr:response regulator transcription factor [Streptomyces tubercidicus]WAU10034.1 response regulator transcription factor [Streptomyces tubercidicus]
MPTSFGTGNLAAPKDFLYDSLAPFGPRVPVAVHARDPISREGVLSALKDDSRIELCDKVSPGGVVLHVDHTLGRPALTQLRRAVGDDRAQAVLVVEMLQDEDLHEVVSHGISAVVWRHEATPSRLTQAVLAAARGDGDLPADLLGRLIRQMGTKPPHTAVGGSSYPAQELTPREVDVMRLVAEGFGTVDIAVKLSYSERTIKDIMYKLTTRLNLRNRAHAVAYALRKGYI